MRPRLLVAGLAVLSLSLPSAAVALTGDPTDVPRTPDAPPASPGHSGETRSVETVGGTVVVTVDDGSFTRAEPAAAAASAPASSAYPVGFLALEVEKVKKGSGVGMSLQLPVDTDGLLSCTDTCTAVDSTLSDGVRSLTVVDGGPLDGDGSADGALALLLAPTAAAPAPACELAPGPRVVHTWEGTMSPAALVATGDDVTDTFSLPPDCAASAVTVRITWENAAEDIDLAVTDPAGTEVVSQDTNALSNSAAEQVEVAPMAGTYTSEVRSFANADTAFTGEVVALITGDATGEEPVEEPPVGLPVNPGAARTVVADLDSAINPYHSAFYAGGLYYPDSAPQAVTQEVLDALNVAPENVVQLTRTGNFEADFAADQAFWDSVQPQTPYHFLGTNIVATSFAPADTPGGHLVPHPDKSAHGVGTASSVLAANPETVLYFVEQDSNLGSAESHAHAFLHPAVDIVTTSYGVSIPNTGFPLPEAWAFEHTYEGVVEQGKLHFSSGGNGPGLTPLRAGAGPWWSIGVGGFEEGSSNGQTTLSGRFPDFVSDFTQEIPYCHACEAGTDSVGGTSFSTPRAAGVASRVLLEARRAASHVGSIADVGGVPTMVAGDRPVTNWQLRRALEQAAHVPGTGEYDPVAGVLDLGAIPVNDAAPWAQVGWGELSADPSKGVVAGALTVLGGGDVAKATGFCEFQTGVITVRKAYWDEVASNMPGLLGEQPPGAPAEDPFVYC